MFKVAVALDQKSKIPSIPTQKINHLIRGHFHNQIQECSFPCFGSNPNLFMPKGKIIVFCYTFRFSENGGRVHETSGFVTFLCQTHSLTNFFQPDATEVGINTQHRSSFLDRFFLSNNNLYKGTVNHIQNSHCEINTSYIIYIILVLYKLQ